MKKISLAIVLLLSLTLAVGCGKAPRDSLLKTELTGVFRSTVVDLPEGYTVSDAPTYRDGLFTTDLFYTDDGGDTFYVDLNRKTLTFDKSGESQAISDATDSKSRTWTVDGAELLIDDKFVATFTSDDGSATLDLPRIFDYDLEKDDDRYGTSSSMFGVMKLLATSDSTYCILTTEGLLSLDSSGNIRWTQTELDSPSDVVMTEQGLFYLCGSSLWLLNEINGKTSEKVDLPSHIADGVGIGGSAAVSFYPGDKTYDFFAATSAALWGISLSTDGDGKVATTAVECVNWLNSDVSPSSLAALCVADCETLTAIQRRPDGNRLLLMTQVPEDELKAKTILSLASLSDDSGFNTYIYSAIEEFNRSSEGYRIVVTDFSTYAADVRNTIFGAEIAAGNVPDIVLMSVGSSDDTTVTTLVESRIIADLTPLMAETKSFDASKLLGYVTKPYTTDGKQYVFPFRPSTETEFGMASRFDGPMTAEEVFAAIDALGEGEYFTTSGFAFKNHILASTVNDFIDKNHGTSSFSSASYISILRNLSMIPTDRQMTGLTVPETYDTMRSGKLMLYRTSPLSLYRYFEMSMLMGDAPVAVGYPNAERKLYVRNDGGAFFAVTEGCEHKAAAVDFLGCILDTFETMNYNEGNYAFFADDVYRQLEKNAGRTFVLDGGKVRGYADADLPEGVEGRKLTAADAESYIAFLNAIDAILPTDSPLYDIVTDEYYASESRSPEQVAEVIQSRAEIFMAEKYQ